jgi:hypothetical protein
MKVGPVLSEKPWDGLPMVANHNLNSVALTFKTQDSTWEAWVKSLQDPISNYEWKQWGVYVIQGGAQIGELQSRPGIMRSYLKNNQKG